MALVGRWPAEFRHFGLGRYRLHRRNPILREGLEAHLKFKSLRELHETKEQGKPIGESYHRIDVPCELDADPWAADLEAPF